MNGPNDSHDLDLAVNSLKNMKIELAGPSRRRIAALCRDSMARERRPALIRWATGRMTLLTPGRMAAALALAVLGFVLFTALPHRSAVKESEEPVRLVSVAATSTGGISLEWSDGNQRVYRVLKSTNPRSFARAESHAVMGHRWTDESPSVGSVVYYKVE